MLTAESLIRMRERLAAIPVAPTIKIFVSDTATKQGAPRRIYPKHRSKSPAHLRRMRKKWEKRYGFRRDPCIYEMRNGLFGASERIIVVHPMLERQLRQAMREGV
jgi:hypothetical protein